MKLKIVLGLMILSLSSNLVSQNAELEGGLFQNIDEPSIYHYYKGKQLLVYWVYENNPNKVVEIDTLNYGFYNVCDIPSIDSLKQSGKYYFEIDAEDFEEGERFDRDCGEMEIYKEGDKTMMNIYYSSSQQFVTYMKIEVLPEKVQRYLQKKGVSVSK
ncbi:hypothetical protein [Labilibaculum sp.]|uniref:hypothetical protein n=1 Tax=Labilibaculum sp. TaxID=2060723 RepID=UPI002AA7EBA3|nr:hypothetical protein [Labilibaculum sp.]